jgi:hypothetical protein
VHGAAAAPGDAGLVKYLRRRSGPEKASPPVADLDRAKDSGSVPRGGAMKGEPSAAEPPPPRQFIARAPIVRPQELGPIPLLPYEDPAVFEIEPTPRALRRRGRTRG